MRTIYLHIGLHKTGTTSLQRFLGDQADWLRANGKIYPNLTNQFGAHTHFGLNIYALDEDRDSPAILRFRAHGRSIPEYKIRFREYLNQRLDAEPDLDFILSNEGLSYVRRPEEIARLGRLFSGTRVLVVLCLREPAGYLASYKKELAKTGIPESADPASSFYCGEDTWLLDYDALIDAYARGFGTENLRYVDYDHEMRKNGNVIPAMLRQFDLDLASAQNLGDYRLNQTTD